MPAFIPPPYPYDRLNGLKERAGRHDGGCIDLSIGTPFDPPAAAVIDALASSGAERSYPPSIGTLEYRQAACRWLERRFGITVDPAHSAASIGTKEFVAGLPHWLRLRTPERDTVLYPAVSYPSYAMGATLGGCRAVPVALRDDWSLDLDAIEESDVERALCLWSNTPGNPAGGLDDLTAVAEWGRSRGVPVFSDECYIEFTWSGPGRSVLSSGLDGVVALHSLSKRSNLAGARAGFYLGDPELVHYLRELRKHAGFMLPGPVQAAAVVAFDDDEHVDAQRARYHGRLELARSVLAGLDIDAPMPGGGFYLWARADGEDGWSLAERLADELGVLASPGEFYGDTVTDRVRLAMVQPDDQIERISARAG